MKKFSLTILAGIISNFLTIIIPSVIIFFAFKRKQEAPITEEIED